MTVLFIIGCGYGTLALLTFVIMMWAFNSPYQRRAWFEPIVLSLLWPLLWAFVAVGIMQELTDRD